MRIQYCICSDEYIYNKGTGADSNVLMMKKCEWHCSVTFETHPLWMLLILEVIVQCISALSLFLSYLPYNLNPFLFPSLTSVLLSLLLMFVRCWTLSGEKRCAPSSQCFSFPLSQIICRDVSLHRSNSIRRWNFISVHYESKTSECVLKFYMLCVFILQASAYLREMCVVFAGPFPVGVSEGEVRRLFCCCGPVRRIKMLNSAFRVNCICNVVLIYSS